MTDARPRAVLLLDRSIEVLNNTLKVILTVAFATILIVTLVQVAARNGLMGGFTGAEEVARFLMVGTTFLAIPILVNQRLNIAVDALAHYLPRGVIQVWLQRVIYLVEAAFFAIFAYYAWTSVFAGYQRTGQASPELGVPLTWPTLVMVLGAALGAIVTVAHLARTFLYPREYHRVLDTTMAIADGGQN